MDDGVLAGKSLDADRITVVESPEIGIIGVGDEEVAFEPASLMMTAWFTHENVAAEALLTACAANFASA